MAVDKLVDSTQLDADLTSVANAIRTKGGTSAQMAFPAGFVQAIGAISGCDYDTLAMRQYTGIADLITSTTVKAYAFESSGITQANGEDVTAIGAHSFAYCNDLTGISFPNVATIDEYAFGRCGNLETCVFPKVTTLGIQAFYQVKYKNNSSTIPNTGYLVLPALETMGNMCCQQSRFDTVDLGSNFHAIPYDAFYSAHINQVVLRSATLVTAYNRDCVRNLTKIYVPEALLTDYTTATNWALDAGTRTVLPIEGSIYENYYADGTPITQGGTT